MGPTDCPETSVRNYTYSLRNSPQEHSSRLLRGGSLTSGPYNYHYHHHHHHLTIIIEFLTSQLWLGNIHLSWDVVINRIRLGGPICSSRISYNWTCAKNYRFLQLYIFIRVQVKSCLVIIIIIIIIIITIFNAVVLVFLITTTIANPLPRNLNVHYSQKPTSTGLKPDKTTLYVQKHFL